MHIVLLGDSIFDNKSYVLPNEPDVRDQVENLLSDGQKVSLLARDGAMIHDISGQVSQIPGDATHLVMSVGGNDAIQKLFMLGMAVSTLSEALLQMASVQAEFEQSYSRVVDILSKRNLPTVLCTIYYPRYEEQVIQQALQTAVNIYDDSIIRIATGVGWPVIDLRSVCTTDEDYANPIEPSAIGGLKIASALVKSLHEYNFSQQQTTIFTS